jgi:hypothetical protein
MLKTTLKSLVFLTELQRRIQVFSGATVQATLVAPDTIRWWYWIEFGSALRGEAGYASGKAYPIDPVQKLVLSWPSSNGTVYRAHVDHPGIRPRAFIRKVLPDIQQHVGSSVAGILVSTYNPASAQSALSQALKDSVITIANSLALEAPGTRVDGRLGGVTASEAFAAQVQVQE